MKFRVGGTDTSYRSIRFPILQGKYIYSPSVWSDNKLISPWTSDVLLLPSRELKPNDNMGTAFCPTSVSQSTSDWPYYAGDNCYGDTELKVISAFNNSQGSGTFFSYKASNKSFSVDNWAHKYYDGYEIDYNGQITGTNNNFGGVFWNLNNFSGITADTQKMKYCFGGVVSVFKDFFQPYKNKSYTYNWPAGLPGGHIYNSIFGFNATARIIQIGVTGDLDPFTYKLNISFKGGNYISARAGENPNEKGILYIGSNDSQLETSTKTTTVSANLNNMVTGSTDVVYLNGQNANSCGIVRHFNAEDNYEYFAIDGVVSLSSCWNGFQASGISTPVFALTTNRNNLSYTNGAIWKNATATAMCNDGTTARKTGTFDLAPYYYNTINWVKNEIGVNPHFWIDDIKFGVSATP